MSRNGVSRESDDEVLNRLHRDHGASVYAFFRRRGFSADECEDLRQDVFLRAHRKLKPGIDNERGWLFSVVRTVWKNELRYRQAGKRFAPETSLTHGADEPPLQLRNDDAFARRDSSDPRDELLREERSRRLPGALLSHNIARGALPTAA